MEISLQEKQKILIEILKETVKIFNKHNIEYFLHCGSALGAIRHGGIIPWDDDIDLIIPFNQHKKMIKVLRKELPDKFFVDYYDNNKYYPGTFPRIGLKGYSTKDFHVDLFRLIGISEHNEIQERLTEEAKELRRIHSIKTKRKSLIRHLRNDKLILFRRLRYIFRPIEDIRERLDFICTQIPYEEAIMVTNPAGGYGMKNVMRKSNYGNGTLMNFEGVEVRIPEKYDEYLKHYYGNYLELPKEYQNGEWDKNKIYKLIKTN